VNPLALETLQKHGFAIAHLRSKGWGEFEALEAPKMDFIVTVCDNAAGEVCPVWPGKPISAHWAVPDPAAVEGSEHDERAAFARACQLLASRIGLFINLPMDRLDRASLQAKMRDIGHAT
jgi:arsenate reductase